MNKKISLDEKWGMNEVFSNLLKLFSKQAKREDWTIEEIKEFLEEATKEGSNHLLKTLVKYTR